MIPHQRFRRRPGGRRQVNPGGGVRRNPLGESGLGKAWIGPLAPELIHFLRSEPPLGIHLPPERLGPFRTVLDTAATAAGLRGRDGAALRVTPHQLRHTYGTTLINAGMSLQALMALMGHVSAEMTLRYASLASPTVRAAYEAAMNKVRVRTALVIAPTGKTAVPARVDWLRSEMLKTRVAHGYCSRDLVAEARPYANICE